MVTPLAASKAYAAVQKIAAAPVPTVGQAPDGASGGPSFAELVRNAVGDVTTATRRAETQMVNQAKGKGNLIDVVTAVSSAQTSLQTVMAVRDQVIAAYQEILRLQI